MDRRASPHKNRMSTHPRDQAEGKRRMPTHNPYKHKIEKAIPSCRSIHGCWSNVKTNQSVVTALVTPALPDPFAGADLSWKVATLVPNGNERRLRCAGISYCKVSCYRRLPSTFQIRRALSVKILATIRERCVQFLPLPVPAKRQLIEISLCMLGS
jgi:hypothetical protein